KFMDRRGDVYTIEKELGQGGMGAVCKIVDERTGLERAMKIIRPAWLSESSKDQRTQAVKRFKREMDIVSRLHNPFILASMDILEIPNGEETVLGFVTDLVEGTDLKNELEKHKTGLPPKESVEYAGEIAMALMSLDEIGLVHRDLKPANIFLEDMPGGKKLVRVGDFGLVTTSHQIGTEKISDEWQQMKTTHAERITNVGSVLGTPDFMSPEQLRGDTLTSSSDLYALGAIMYEMLSGKPVFKGNNFYDNARQHLEDRPQALPKEIPDWLQSIVMKLLEKKPEDRLGSAKEVFVALKEGVKKDFPELLHDVPFMWNVASDIDPTRFAVH
ncbi:MAG: serine/threonine-protein kinase, partial [Patescibacteria group bacterium]